MVAAMVQHAYTPGVSAFITEPVFGQLSPVVKARAILEQVVYKSYLQHTVRNVTVCLEDYFNMVDSLVRTLPSEDRNLSGPESALYHACVSAIQQFPRAELSTYDNLLGQPCDCPLWSPTIPRDFYIPYLTTIGCPSGDGIDEVISPVILLPRFELYDRPLIDKSLTAKQAMRIAMDTITVAAYTPTQVEQLFRDTEHFFQVYLGNFKYTDWSTDQFVGMFSRFCLEPGKHAMRAPSNYRKGVADICYEIVHPRPMKWVSTRPKLKHGDVYGADSIVALFKYLASEKQLASGDNKLLADFLSRYGVCSQEVGNYLTKPVEEITALESMAFHDSELSKFISVRFEAETPEVPGTEGTAENDTPVDDPSTDDSTSTVDPTIDTDTGEAEEPKEPKAPPKRDPAQMLIDLANTEEKLSDYLYRRLVVERMTALVLNPPTGIPSSEILFMKRYLSMWVHLLSVPSIKDYISRLSFKLMADDRIRGTAYLK